MRRWLPPAAWAGFLLFLGTRPGDDLPASGLWALPGADKAAHALAYGVLGFLLERALAARPGRRALLIGAAAGLAWGLLDEWLQGFVAGRSRDPADLAADTAGAAAGAWIAFRTFLRKDRWTD